MAKLTEKTGATIDLTQFEDDEPYRVTLKQIGSIKDKEYEGKKYQELDVTWELEDGTTLMDWLSLSLGTQQNGTVSKFRQFLNALAREPRDTSIKWFDDEELTWNYDGTDKPYLKLEAGLEAILSGEIRKRKNTEGKKFVITRYKAPKAAKKRAADYEEDEIEQRKRAKVQDVPDSEIPF